MIRYDSTYSWSYATTEGASPKTDSLMRDVQARFRLQMENDFNALIKDPWFDKTRTDNSVEPGFETKIDKGQKKENPKLEVATKTLL